VRSTIALTRRLRARGPRVRGLRREAAAYLAAARSTSRIARTRAIAQSASARCIVRRSVFNSAESV
jgi:hypothetical protein